MNVLAQAVTNEFGLHIYAVQLLELFHAPGVVFFHCPNGEFRSKRTAARLKRMGVRKGVADLCLVLPDGKAAFLELKSSSGRQSPDQRAFHSEVTASGGLYGVANSPESVRAILGEWGAVDDGVGA